MLKQKRQRKNRVVDDGYTYLLLDNFTQNISILFGSPKSIVQLDGEDDAPKTLVYESTLQNRKWLDIKLNLCDFWSGDGLTESATIKDWLTAIAKQCNKLDSPDIQATLNNPTVTDDGEAQLNDLFHLANSIFDDGHGLIVVESIGTLHPEIKANYSGGTSQLFSKELDQQISIADFTVFALAVRDAIVKDQLDDAKAIVFETVYSLLKGIKDKSIRSAICRDVGLALVEQASETLIK